MEKEWGGGGEVKRDRVAKVTLLQPRQEPRKAPF